MTSRAKRLSPIVAAVAIAAVLIGSVLAPGPAAAKKPSDPDAFTISMTLREYTWSMSGSFSASGAIKDSGTAVASVPAPSSEVYLHGKDGSIYIDMIAPDYRHFTITGGTGAYTGLSGSGTYTFDATGKGMKYTLEGTVGQ